MIISSRIFEVLSLKIQLLEKFSSIKTEPTGDIPDPKGKPSAKKCVRGFD